MSRDVLVSDIMTHKVICANLNNKLSQVLDFFSIFKIQHLPVLDDEKIVGIISNKDVLEFINIHLKKSESLTESYLDNNFSLESIMTKNPITIRPDALIDEVFQQLAPGNIQCMIVESNGILKGIITTKDLIRFHVSGFNTNHDSFTTGASGFGV